MKKTVIKELREALTARGTTKDQATGKVTLALSVSDKRHRAKTSFIRATSLDLAGRESLKSWHRHPKKLGYELRRSTVFNGDH